MLDEVYAHVTDDHKSEVMSRMGIASSAVTSRVTEANGFHVLRQERPANSKVLSDDDAAGAALAD
jgi:hypothetical protein